MARFPEMVLESNAAYETKVLERPVVGEMLMRSIIYWVWLIPIAVYVVRFATKLTKDNGYPWYYLIGGV